jgi:hypothetical protein
LKLPQLMKMYLNLSCCHRCPKTQPRSIRTGRLHQMFGHLVQFNVRDVAKPAEKGSGLLVPSKLCAISVFTTKEFRRSWKRQLGV